MLWSGEGSLYEFDAAKAWKERGKGELRINRAPGRTARFVMRQKGQHRLLMNANLWPLMKVTPMDGGKVILPSLPCVYDPKEIADLTVGLQSLSVLPLWTDIIGVHLYAVSRGAILSQVDAPWRSRLPILGKSNV